MQEALELKPKGGVEGKETLSPKRPSGGGGGGGVGRGWAKFRSPAAVAPAPPPVKQREEEKWVEGSMSMGQLSTTDGQGLQPARGHAGSGGFSDAGEGDEENSALHKTESCDSGITKSDLRIDRAGDSRSSFERSPLERSPFGQVPGLDAEGALRHSFTQPVSEQALFHATLHQTKLEIKGDIKMLSCQLSVLEVQVSEILRLLSVKRRLSLPQTSTPKRIKSPGFVCVPEPISPDMDDGPF